MHVARKFLSYNEHDIIFLKNNFTTSSDLNYEVKMNADSDKDRIRNLCTCKL